MQCKSNMATLFLNKSTASRSQRLAAAAFRKFCVEKGNNYVKNNLRITCPTGISSPFDSESEFQVNIFSNDRDFRKCQSFCTTTPTEMLPTMTVL